MLSILHVINSLDPAHGGPSSVVFELTAAQKRLGHRVGVLVGLSASAPNAERFDFPGEAELPRLEVWQVPRPSLRDILTGWAARQLLPVVAGYDVLHVHGVWDPLLYGAAAAARQEGIPYVVAPHGMLDPWSLSQKRWKKRLALALGYRRMLDGAGALQVLNVDEERLIRPLGLRSPACFVPNGVTLNPKLAPPAGSFRARHPGLGDCPLVLFLGRLHAKKGLDYLVEAFAAVVRDVPNAQLVIAGPDDGAREGLERATKEHGLNGCVHLVGPLYGIHKWSALVDADCFCLPSRQEGFSIAILEAMACGVPVVISENCHFPEVADAGAGLVVPLDAGKVAAALGAVLAEADGRVRMGRAGRALVAARYTWSQVAARSVEMYRRLLSPAEVTDGCRCEPEGVPVT